MRFQQLTDRSAVLKAIAEFDTLGRAAFLRKYGFRSAKSYYLKFNGKRYDSKAIVGSAIGYQFPENGPLRSQNFSGGEATVAPKLKSLGFEVVQDADVGSDTRNYWAFCASPENLSNPRCCREPRH